uniref:Uncharacterized protein n=1 Tax=Oryza punctata TaxID=4537 RepID=A0A0E0KIB4_ORYPU
MNIHPYNQTTCEQQHAFVT